MLAKSRGSPAVPLAGDRDNPHVLLPGNRKAPAAWVDGRGDRMARLFGTGDPTADAVARLTGGAPVKRFALGGTTSPAGLLSSPPPPRLFSPTAPAFTPDRLGGVGMMRGDPSARSGGGAGAAASRPIVVENSIHVWGSEAKARQKAEQEQQEAMSRWMRGEPDRIRNVVPTDARRGGGVAGAFRRSPG
jgi:hypothetical protein